MNRAGVRVKLESRSGNRARFGACRTVTSGLLLSCLCACGSGGGTPNAVDSSNDSAPDVLDAGDGNADDVDAVGEDADAFSAKPDVQIDSVSNPCPNGVIEIDFPCTYSGLCTSETAYASFKTIGCAEAGYATCCDGQTCRADGGGVCPAGQLCGAPVWSGQGTGGTPCQQPTCKSSADCKGQAYCLKPRGACASAGTLGVCTALPQNGAIGPLNDSGPVCGCDGKTYATFHAVLSAQVSVDYDGPCCDPVKMPFPKENPLGFAQLELCGKGFDFYGDPSPLQSLCPAATGSVFVNIPPAVTGTTLAASDWKHLCGKATAAKRAFGRGGPNCTAAPSPVADCGVGCQDPCGCLQCADAPLTCQGDGMGNCAGGCTNSWSCAGLIFTDKAWGLACDGDCPSIQTTITGKLAQWQACVSDSDCVARASHCAQNACFVPVNAKFSQGEIDAILLTWGNKSCSTCTCAGTTAPMATCTAGMCSL